MFFKRSRRKNKSKANFYTKEGKSNKKRKNELTEEELLNITSQFTLNKKGAIKVLGYVNRWN